MPTPLLAAIQVGSLLAGGLIGGLVGAASLVLRQRDKRRDDVDKKVSNAVDAAIGRSFLDLREVETATRTSLQAAVATASDIESQLRERLQTSERHAAALGDLLDKASDVLPTLASKRAAIPALLLAQAQATPELGTATDALYALLDAEGASSEELSAGGDVANGRLESRTLAIALYERALSINPQDAQASASLIYAQARAGVIPQSESLERAASLARANLGERNVLSEVLNLFQRFGDTRSTLAFVDELIEMDDSVPLLWRNRAVQLQGLKHDEDALRAYERAYELSRSNPSEASNTARPFVGFLIRSGEYVRAREVVEEALTVDARSSLLLSLLADLNRHEGDIATARACVTRAISFARNARQKAMFEEKLADLDSLGELRSSGLVRGGDGRRDHRPAPPVAGPKPRTLE